jgi:hypothetical protein
VLLRSFGNPSSDGAGTCVPVAIAVTVPQIDPDRALLFHQPPGGEPDHPVQQRRVGALLSNSRSKSIVMVF